MKDYWSKENKRIAILLYYKVKEIAYLMKWHFDLCEFSDCYEIHDGKGNKIIFRSPYRDRSRIEITCGIYGVQKISVSIKKSSRSIVLNDIKNRFFPEFKIRLKQQKDEKRTTRNYYISEIKEYLELGKVAGIKYKSNIHHRYNVPPLQNDCIKVEKNLDSNRYKFTLTYNCNNKEHLKMILQGLKAINSI